MFSKETDQLLSKDTVLFNMLILWHISDFTQLIIDGVVKSPISALRFISRHCGAR